MLQIYLEKVARNKNILNLKKIQASMAETASFLEYLIFILPFRHRN